MKRSIEKELVNYIIDLINDNVLNNNNINDWHYHAFNEDYYIIGYYNASQWLKKHGLDEFEAVGICQQYEIDNFGENHTIYDNSEKVVNMLVYIYGEELIYSKDFKTVKQLKKSIKELI
jgi:hypothetical protein